MARLTVLGAAGAYPSADQACSGYLLEYDRTRLVLDLGYATLPQLLARVPDGAVDGVVITHEHPDHCIDLHGLLRLRHHAYPGSPRIPLFSPPQVLDRLTGLEPDLDLTTVFAHRPLPGRHVVGPITVTGVPLPHFVPTVGVRLSAEGLTVSYATDTGPCDELADLGRDVDLFVLDATDRPGETASTSRGLLSATEAGEWAVRAGARRLLLTHLWPGTDPETSLARARSRYDGPIVVARQGTTLDLP